LSATLVAGLSLVACIPIGDTIYMILVTNRCESTVRVVDAGWAASDHTDHWDALEMGAVEIALGETQQVGVMSPEPGHYLAVGDLSGAWSTGPEVNLDAARSHAEFVIEGEMCP